MKSLTVNVSNAVLNKSHDFFGDMENYVVVRLIAGGNVQQEKTKTAKGKKQQPINWNQQFTFQIPSNALSSARLEFFVKDEDLTSDDICGQGIVNLEHCKVFTGKQSYALRLYDAKKIEIQGDLYFSTTFR